MSSSRCVRASISTAAAGDDGLVCFLTGILGVTSYTIRISATQSYVPDEKKGRFNGAFNMLNTVGSFTGNLLAGALVAFLPVRGVLTGFMLVTGSRGNRRHRRRTQGRVRDL